MPENKAIEKNAPGQFIHYRRKTPGTNVLIRWQKQIT